MTGPLDEARIEELRHSLGHGERVSQQQLNAVATELAPAKDQLRPKDKSERLPLFDREGKSLGTTAPRWICHLLALRHLCAHILLLWKSPALGDALVLQIRDWKKDDSPGRVDISVGGHMTAEASSSAEATAFEEMLQETGLTAEDLGGPLENVGGYAYDESRPADRFHNSEWRDVYVGRVKPDCFGKIRFPDGEVAAVVLVPLEHATDLLAQGVVPMASALTKSLPKCLERCGRPG